jgi:hypothetical protein
MLKGIFLFIILGMQSVFSFYYYINEPTVFLRKEAKIEHSHVESELVFAEQVFIIQKGDTWTKIKNFHDSDEGYVSNEAIISRLTPYNNSSMIKTNRLKCHLYGISDTEEGPILSLPFGVMLRVKGEYDQIKNSSSRWLLVELPDGKEAYIQRGDITFEDKLITLKEMIDFSYQFLNLAYVWGGRSSFGFDCSGFVQMLYNQMGINLYSTSREQYNDSDWEEITLAQLLPGDLIFWGKNNDKIGHVGMYIGNNQFIHSCASVENKPYIRISSLSDNEWKGFGDVRYPFRAFKHLKGLIAQ